MFYQPIADTKTGKIRGMEALLRWELDPADSTYGCTEDAQGNGRLFRQCQCGGGTAGAQRVPQCCHEYFKRDRCEAGGALPRIDRTMQRSGYSFPAWRSGIFHSQGIKIALDDFGTGNSSLSLALELPFDELKVDMSFIRDIKQKPQNQAMVQSIVDYARRLTPRPALRVLRIRKSATISSSLDLPGSRDITIPNRYLSIGLKKCCARNQPKKNK